MVKNPPDNAGDMSSIPGLGRSPPGGQGNPLQNSCLENPMDREAWQATVHRVAKSETRLKQLSTLAWGSNFSSNVEKLDNCPILDKPFQSLRSGY